MSTNEPTPTDWLGHPIPPMSPELAARLREAADADMAELVDESDPMPPELVLRSIMAAREELLTGEVRQLNAHLARIADALEQMGLAR